MQGMEWGDHVNRALACWEPRVNCRWFELPQNMAASEQDSESKNPSEQGGSLPRSCIGNHTVSLPHSLNLLKAITWDGQDRGSL